MTTPSVRISRRRFGALAAALMIGSIGEREGQAAGAQAVDVSGEYLGTYTPQGGQASQLQMSLDPLQPGQGSTFSGDGSVRVNDILFGFDLTGTARRRRREIRVVVEFEGNETNDTLTFRGVFNRRRGRISGRFDGTLNGSPANGRFRVDRV